MMHGTAPFHIDRKDVHIGLDKVPAWVCTNAEKPTSRKMRWMRCRKGGRDTAERYHEKTRWGSCNTEARRIWLNLELFKKPASCLEYILAHEMAHFLERRHNERFRESMDALIRGVYSGRS